MTTLGILRQKDSVKSGTNHPHQQQLKSSARKTLQAQKQQPSKETTAVAKFKRKAIKISLGSMRHGPVREEQGNG